MANRNSRRSIQRRSLPYYTKTSEALVVKPNTAPQQRRKRRPVPRRAKIVRYKLVNEGIKINYLAMTTIVIIFLGLMSIAAFFTIIAEKQSEISRQNNLYKKLQEANLITKAQISQGYDLKEIERIAITRLEMSKPKPHQIVYISVPKQSYVTQSNNSEKPKNPDIIGNILDNIDKIIK